MYPEIKEQAMQHILQYRSKQCDLIMSHFRAVQSARQSRDTYCSRYFLLVWNSVFNSSVYLHPSFIANLHMIELYQWALEPNSLIEGFVYTAVLLLQYVHTYQKMFLHASKNNGLPVNIPYTKLNVWRWHVTTICDTVVCNKLLKNFHNVNHVRITNKQQFD